MLRIQDKRVRILVSVGLLAIIGYAIYQGVIYYWSGRHHEAALAALQRFDYDEAADRLKSYLAFQPKDCHALLLAAETARRRNSFDEADAYLRLAQKHGAPRESVDAERHLLRVQSGDLEGVSELMQFCRENPDGPQAATVLEALIEGGMRGKNPRLARDAVDLWLRHRNGKLEQAQGLVWRGRCNLTFDRRVPLPQDDFQQAVELAPDHFFARLYLAAGFIGAEPQKAIPHLDWLRQHRPNDLSVRFQLARYYRNSGQPEDAARVLDELIATAPGDKFSALVERGRAAMDMNKLDDAEKYLRQALAITSLRIEVNRAMADCMRQQHRLEEARQYQEKVDDIDAKIAKAVEEWKKLEEAANAKKQP
jgi:tetratricopeptide (TPR) repeat protein